MADGILQREIDEYIEKVWEDVIADITSLVAIDSVEDLASSRPGAPWGEGPETALELALGIAERLGLEPHNDDGFIGYADLKGTDGKQIATIGHVDTVPVGTGWVGSPYEVIRKDGCIVGRGVADDKGPTVLSLYAAKYFLEKGITPRHDLRCIIGCNEETGMSDVVYYNEHHDQPDFLFTPDAGFPAGYGEKGFYQAFITSAELPEDRIIVKIEGGIVTNAVAGEASALVRADASALPAKERIEVSQEGELARIDAHGIGSHASTPQDSINAIGLLVDYLLENGLFCEAEEGFLRLVQQILSSYDGSSIGVDCTDEYFDALTLIGGIIKTEGNRFVQSIDSRFPTTMSAERLTAVLSELASACGATIETGHTMAPFVTDPQSAPIRILAETFNEVAGVEAEPYTMGGGTYARHFKSAASFGPAFDERFIKPEWVGSEHGPNEGILEENLKFALKVYILTLLRLMEVDF